MNRLLPETVNHLLAERYYVLCGLGSQSYDNYEEFDAKLGGAVNDLLLLMPKEVKGIFYSHNGFQIAKPVVRDNPTNGGSILYFDNDNQNGCEVFHYLLNL